MQNHLVFLSTYEFIVSHFDNIQIGLARGAVDPIGNEKSSFIWETGYSFNNALLRIEELCRL